MEHLSLYLSPFENDYFTDFLESVIRDEAIEATGDPTFLAKCVFLAAARGLYNLTTLLLHYECADEDYRDVYGRGHLAVIGKMKANNSMFSIRHLTVLGVRFATSCLKPLSQGYVHIDTSKEWCCSQCKVSLDKRHLWFRKSISRNYHTPRTRHLTII